VPEKLFNALLGVVWMVSGELVAFYPAPPHQPHDRSRAAAIPYVGIIIIAAGVWFIVRAVREARAAQASTKTLSPIPKSTRHAAAADIRDSLRMIAVSLGVVALGGGTLW
jgi:hypothetical protein